ncbi:MAG: DUF6602 domain-containing protein [Blastocatellia bacterium]
MSELTRNVIFEQAAKKLRAEFEELSVIPHKGAKGSEAEDLMKTFLRSHLPRRFAVGSGFIIDKLNEVSKQTDVVIFDAFNCPVYRASDDASIFPNDNVAAIVEVKAALDKDRLIEACENIRAAKRLAKTPMPDDFPFLVSTQTLGCIFAYRSSITLNKIVEHYQAVLGDKGFNAKDQVDIIAVLDRGIITFVAQPKGRDWTISVMDGLGGPEMEGGHIGFGIQHLGYAALDGFFRFLLSHLMLFRGMIDHPGFDWRSLPAEGKTKITYMTSITYEKDPEKRKENLRAYREEARKDFEQNPAPANEDPEDLSTPSA